MSMKLDNNLDHFDPFDDFDLESKEAFRRRIDVIREMNEFEKQGHTTDDMNIELEIEWDDDKLPPVGFDPKKFIFENGSRWPQLDLPGAMIPMNILSRPEVRKFSSTGSATIEAVLLIYRVCGSTSSDAWQWFARNKELRNHYSSCVQSAKDERKNYFVPPKRGGIFTYSDM